MPVMTALNPSRRCGLSMADLYMRIMAIPFMESHRVMAAAKASGIVIRANGETPARVAAVVMTSRPMVVAVSNPKPKRKPIT